VHTNPWFLMGSADGEGRRLCDEADLPVRLLVLNNVNWRLGVQCVIEFRFLISASQAHNRPKMSESSEINQLLVGRTLLLVHMFARVDPHRFSVGADTEKLL
jgi:hypothetical protein